MNSDDHNTYLEWLFLESDNLLTPGERGRLREHLGTCDSCETERQSLVAMNQILKASLVPVRQGFSAEVMTALQPAGWEAKSPRTWVAAAIVLFLLTIGAALLTGWGAMDDAPALAPLAAASVAVFDFLQSSALAGAGLLSASWRGIGLAFSTLLSGSPWTAASFIVLVVGVDLLLLKLLLRPKGHRDSVAARSGSGPRLR